MMVVLIALITSQTTILQVRLYALTIEDADILTHIQSKNLVTEKLQRYVNLHYKFEDASNSSYLYNDGILTTDAQVMGNPVYVKVKTVFIHFTSF